MSNKRYGVTPRQPTREKKRGRLDAREERVGEPAGEGGTEVDWTGGRKQLVSQ